MKIYVVFRIIDWEGGMIAGVYTTGVKAQQRCAELNINQTTYPYEYNEYELDHDFMLDI